jgi:hypothetical protein
MQPPIIPESLLQQSQLRELGEPINPEFDSVINWPEHSGYEDSDAQILFPSLAEIGWIRLGSAKALDWTEQETFLAANQLL